MKLSLFLSLFLISCGGNEKTSCYMHGNNCRPDYVEPTPIPGTNGKDGYSIAMLQTNATTCTNGGFTVFQGLDLNRNGVLKFVPEARVTSFTLCNGKPGDKGDQGNPGVSPTIGRPILIIDPCGPQSQYDEVILRLPDNTLISSFSDNANGQNTRFSILKPGSYITSDSTGCYFTVDSNLNITNEHN